MGWWVIQKKTLRRASKPLPVLYFHKAMTKNPFNSSSNHSTGPLSLTLYKDPLSSTSSEADHAKQINCYILAIEMVVAYMFGCHINQIYIYGCVQCSPRTELRKTGFRCNFLMVWQYSNNPNMPRIIGKLPNHSKNAPGGLWKRGRKRVFFLENEIFFS